MLRPPVLRAFPRLPPPRSLVVQKRTLFGRRPTSGRPVESLNYQRMHKERADHERTRRNFLWAGTIAGVISFVYTAYKLQKALDEPPVKADTSLPPTDPLLADGKRKVVVRDEEGRELVPTGNSTVPTFPRTIDLPTTFSSGEHQQQPSPTPSSPDPTPPLIVPPYLQRPPTTEYTLVGLGPRSVSFLGINVYVVGFYVATADIASLQSRLVKQINPIATTLVPDEKAALRKALLDPEESEATWDALLQEDGVLARSAFRIVPVRDTDFHHLRDGFVRAIQARSDKIIEEGAALAASKDSIAPTTTPTPPEGAAELAKESFGESMRAFRQAFNRGKVPKAKELLLVRERDGTLRIVYSDGSNKRHRQLIGTVDDERVSRALWLNWLGGRKVASEVARASIVDGVMEFVERPMGTVAAQVV